MTDFDLTPAQSGMLDEVKADPIRPSTDGAIVAKMEETGQLVEIGPEGNLKDFDGPEQLEEPIPETPVPPDLAAEIDGTAEEVPVVDPDSEDPDDFKPSEIDLKVDTLDDVGAEVARAMDRHDEVLILDEIAERAISTMVYSFEQSGKVLTDLSVAGVNEVVRLMNERGGCQIGISEQQPFVEEFREGDKDYYRVMIFAKDARFPETGRWGTATEPKIMATKKGPIWDKFALTKALNKAQRNALKMQIPEEWRQVIIAQSKGTPALKMLQPLGSGAVAELPPALDDEQAQLLKKEIHEAYGRLKEFNRLAMPPGMFNAYLTKAETESHERLEVFRDSILELVQREEGKVSS